MVELPAPGTRVSVRYRLPAGSQPALSDVVGHLLATTPLVRVQPKDGAVVEFSATDVVTVRVLTAVPVRNSQIRAVEHAATLAWPGLEQRWLDGWLLRAAGGTPAASAAGYRVNSAVPLEMHARLESLPQIMSWYADRGLTPWLALPDRLVRTPGGVRPELEALLLVSPLSPAQVDAGVSLTAHPDEQWLQLSDPQLPAEVLTAVLDGEVVFATLPGVAVGRAATTTAPDGTRWLGISAVRVAADQRRRGHARRLCAALLAWGAERGADQAYAQVPATDSAGVALARAVGFTEQHRERYFDARRVLERRV